jgi:hypothetical protein
LLRRVARRVARVFVVFAVVLSVFGASTAAAAVAIGRMASGPTCHCPHDDGDDRRACPCCSPDDDGDHCLPIAGGCGATLALAPPIEAAALIPLPLLVGIAATPDVAELRDRDMHQGLERPPRI